VTSAGLGKLVWPGAILAGLALLGIVALVWPEPTTRIVRLPYGESQPKTPHEAGSIARPARAAVVADGKRTTGRQVESRAPATVEETGRVLAAVEPAATARGPAPVPSPLELAPGYVRESPEQLGAEPLPGTVLTPAPPVAAG
jgi:hypothetical protein